MLTEPTIEKLYALRLGSMAAAFAEQQKDVKVSSLSFDERFGMLVDAEHIARDNRRIKTLLKDADLRIANACIEDVEASAQRGIDTGMLRQLASCAWVDQIHNALIHRRDRHRQELSRMCTRADGMSSRTARALPPHASTARRARARQG